MVLTGTAVLALVSTGSAAIREFSGSTPEPAPPVRVSPSGADAVIELPPRVGEWVKLSTVRLVGAGPNGRAVFLADGAAENEGKMCMFTARPAGATSVVPVVCDPPDRAASRGLDFQEQRTDGSLDGVHVRVPVGSEPIVSLFQVGQRGGRVDIQSGDKTVQLDFGDLVRANATADASGVKPDIKLAYATEGVSSDPYAGFETRVVPENVTLLPKTKDQVTGGNPNGERIHTVKKGDSIASILRDLGASPEEAKSIAYTLGAKGRDGELHARCFVTAWFGLRHGERGCAHRSCLPVR
mgnify:CR=1 FL=1